MEGFGIEKLTMLLVIVLVLFGAKRVPEIGASIGKGIREFKRGMKDLNSDIPEATHARDGLTLPASTPGGSPEATGSEPKRLLAK